MKSVILHFDKLTKSDLYSIIALRISVFVIEQNCPYQDLDGKDQNAFHVLISDEKSDVLIGTARILPAGVSYKEVSIGRVASDTKQRHRKIGHLIMKTSMQFIKDTMNNPDIRISAQSHLCNFYAQYGFVSTGKEYLEDDIPHTEMLYKSDQNSSDKI